MSSKEGTYQVLGLLLKNGIRARLIQSMGGFSLYDLEEVRYFLDVLDYGQEKEPKISMQKMEHAKNKMKERFSDSSCLENCLNMIDTFVMTYPDGYRSDLGEFIKESNYEDFYEDKQGTVYVSTIHKSKGREFDRVYMMLDMVDCKTDEDRRKLYVAMTRAKEGLYIHYNNKIYDDYVMEGIEGIYDGRTYAEPEEIAMQLTHRDVFLGYFKDKKELISKLHAGSPLDIKNNQIFADIDGARKQIGVLSKDFYATLKKLRSDGYHPFRAVVRFIVEWKDRNDEDSDAETPIVLPDIYLRNSTGKI